MCSLKPTDPQLLAVLFDDACFPMWVVDGALHVTTCNKTARASYPAHCLADGVLMFLSPADADELTRAICAGQSIAKHPSFVSRTGVALAFTAFVNLAGQAGASVMLTPIMEPAEEVDLRKGLAGIGSLVVSHVLKKSMANVFTALSTSAARLRAANLTFLDDQLREINHSCYQVMRTSNSLSEEVRLSALLPPNLCVVDFWESCSELLEACTTLLHGRRLDFEYALPTSTVYVNCDFEKITTAILGLLSNAFLHGGKGVQVTVSGRDLGEKNLLLTIADNGPGISKEVQARLFQPFCSWDSVDTQNAGTGLGLHLTRKLVAECGGTVTVNTGDTGTTAALSLPLSQPPAQPCELGSTSAAYMGDRFSPIYFGLCDIVALPEL